MKYCYAVGFIAVLSICLMFGMSYIEKNMIEYAKEDKTEDFNNFLNQNQNINVNAKDQNGNTALIWAALNGNEQIVKLLLDQSNIDINEKGENENTALMWAVINKNEEIVKLLLDQPNINVNEQNVFSETALIFAEKDETIKKMLETAQKNNNIINSFAKALSVLR